jgi:ribonuclease HII
MSELIEKPKRKPPVLLTRVYNQETAFELSIDEAGRGCLFGRVYIACVVLPKEPELFDGKNIKDSKKFSSKKKLNEVADYIKSNALAWYVAWVDSETIDEINILQSVMRGMHDCIRNIMEKLQNKPIQTSQIVCIKNCMAVVDGNYFKPYCAFDSTDNTIQEMPYVTIEQGDAKYMGIAAASILAKTARDNYILELCKQYPILVERYGLDSNMGYGTKKHLEGIRENGITQWHRRTFGEACKNAIQNHIDTYDS